ncbi:concanavalin A-like lectin/glucanase [Gigaspora margarita]|uniref:Concanavalin A-like lectin/glucanase n=1 Tax=Gigaspora margarita TaxID=4874 RepID=A0A8H4B5L5_GIGMA|nr:concanavalin A-like lectin/glucanase [Gigaspora margarita]
MEESPITSTILPPRKKLTTHLPSRNSISNDKEIDLNNYLEIFSGPINFPTNKKTIQHNKLPSVTNELSVTLQLYLKRHDSSSITIFHKGEDTQHARTPALWLSADDSKPRPSCSVKNSWAHFISAGNNLELNKWYHIAYTLSEPQKRMEFYVNGELVGYTDEKDIIFNEFPLKIGHSDKYSDFQGQMSNFRYYNIRLSADEIFKDYISYHSNELGRNRGKILIKKIDPNDYIEIFSKSTYFPTYKKTIQHNELPSVTNELSVTFQMNLEKHDPNWITIFIKGEDEQQAYTPALFLSPNDSKPRPYCSVKNNWKHIISAGDNFELNKWYHIAYTLSVPQKRMEFYVNGEIIGYTDVKDIIFNEFPLKIGHSNKYSDFQGQMSNFRYYNIRLSADEIFKDYILYHSNELDQNRGKLRIKEIDPNDYLEIFSEPTYFPTNKKTIQHNELPSVTNELSVVFQLNLEKHDLNRITIFVKGEDEQHARTPTLWLSPKDSKPHLYCSLKNNWSYNISVGNNLELNKWYHIAYTLSEPQKRMEFYVNGELVGYTDTKDIIFNEFPLKIGHSDKYSDFQGQMKYDLLQLRCIKKSVT